MTLIQKDFELPEGTAVTQANVGASGAPAAVGGSIGIAAAAKAHGATGVRVTNGVGQAASLRFALVAPSSAVSVSVVLTLLVAPTVDTTFFTLRHPTGNILRFQWRSSGALAILDPAQVINNFPGVAPALGTKYRLTVVADQSAGTFTANLYDHATGNKLGSGLTVSGSAMGINPFSHVDLCIASGTEISQTAYYDDLQYNDGSTAELTPMADPTVPLTPSTTAVPVSVITNSSGWTGTAADLADTSTSTYMESPSAPVTGASVTVKLGPLVTPSTFALTVGHVLTVAGTNSATVQLLQGAAVRKEWAINPTTSAKSDVLTMTAAEIATVTDWSALEVRLSWTGS